MREFQNKTYWIVGASEGLGRALAIQLAEVGAKVIISARSEERLIGLSEEIGSNTMVLPMDVSDGSSVQKACSKLPQPLDGFIFVSGVYWHMSASSWDGTKAEEMVDVNLVGAMRCLAHLVPKFINQGFGHIVLTGSIAGYRGLPGSVGYCASKAGLMSLAETLKIDLAKNNIDVQLLNPGYIKTRLTDKNPYKKISVMTPEKAAQFSLSHMRSSRFQL
jgi:short-subunit dehydrogenase